MKGFFLLLFWIGFLHAEEVKEPLVHVIPQGSRYVGDYFAYGSNIEISGDILGDLYVMGGQVTIDGQVHGDLLVLGGSVDLPGTVAGNVRMVGGQLLVSGDVGKNVSAVAGNVQILPCSRIGAGFVCAAGSVDLAAHVGGEAHVVSSHLRVASSIEDNLYAYVGKLRLTSKALIGGNLFYRSNSIAVLEEGSQVDGEITYSPSIVQGWIEGTWIQKLLSTSKILGSLMNFLYSFVVGWILIQVFPKNLEGALYQIQHKPWRVFSVGVLLLIALPLASLVLLITILGVPFALTLIAANIIGFYTAKIYTILFVAHYLCKKFKISLHKMVKLFTGLVVYFLFTAIPFVGMCIAFVSMLVGVGAGVLASTKKGV